MQREHEIGLAVEEARRGRSRQSRGSVETSEEYERRLKARSLAARLAWDEQKGIAREYKLPYPDSKADDPYIQSMIPTTSSEANRCIIHISSKDNEGMIHISSKANVGGPLADPMSNMQRMFAGNTSLRGLLRCPEPGFQMHHVEQCRGSDRIEA
jgi:hypothetical protein